MSIGQKIYELRTAKNLSQGELAEALDVSRQSVSKWETDTSVPDLDKLIKLCDMFEVTLDEITGRRNQTKTPDCNATAVIYTNADSVNTSEKSERISTQKMIGFILLIAGLISLIIGCIIEGVIIIIGVYMTLAGITCLTAKKTKLLAIILVALLILVRIVVVFCSYIIN